MRLCFILLALFYTQQAQGNTSPHITAPFGWTVATPEQTPEGLSALLMPKSISPAPNPSMILIKQVPFSQTVNTVEHVIALDIQDWRSRAPEIRASSRIHLDTKNHKRAIVYTFTGNKDGRSDATAYVQNGQGVSVFVLSSPSLDEFHKDFRAFQRIIGNYETATGPVIAIKHAPTTEMPLSMQGAAPEPKKAEPKFYAKTRKTKKTAKEKKTPHTKKTKKTKKVKKAEKAKKEPKHVEREDPVDGDTGEDLAKPTGPQDKKPAAVTYYT